MTDVRAQAPRWTARPLAGDRRRMRLMMGAALPLAFFYFFWLLDPARMGNPLLYALLVAAELFNLVQALGFWWTCSVQRGRPPLRRRGKRPIDVVYAENECCFACGSSAWRGNRKTNRVAPDSEDTEMVPP